MPLGMLRRPEPENVEEAGARLASLDDDGRVHQRREILRALEAPDVAILHLEEETALGSAQTSLKAQGNGRRGHGAGYPPVEAAHAEEEKHMITTILLRGIIPIVNMFVLCSNLGRKDLP